MVRLRGASNVLKVLYTDQMTVRRYEVPAPSLDGTTPTQTTSTDVYVDIPCRLSFVSTDYPGLTREDKNEISQGIKIFCDVVYDIKAGDILHVTRLDGAAAIAEYKGFANQAYKYPSHQELEFVERDVA